MAIVPYPARSMPLHGRESEKEALFRAFETAKAGVINLVIIGGPSGVGKTLLARTLEDEVLAGKGIFAAGKFNPGGEDSFHHAFGRAFQDMTRQVLAWDLPDLRILRENLMARLKSTGRILTDLSPDLTLILGEFPALPILEPHEARNRFHWAVADFLRAFSELKCPLAILLDDLQWADSDSISLLSFLLSDPALGSMVWVGTTREDASAFRKRLESKVPASGGAILATLTALDLEPWSREELAGFIALTLQTRRSEIGALAELVYTKSRGYPYHSVQMLKTLMAENLLRREAGTGGWVWDAGRIKRLPMAEDLAGLTRERALRISPEAQGALNIAACLGYEFTAAALREVTGDSPGDMRRLLGECLEAELLVNLSDALAEPESGVLAFQHDQVRQAIYEFIPGTERAKLHLRIGRSLGKSQGGVAAESAAHAIADHLIEAIETVDRPEERVRIAGMALRAAQSARVEAAFSLALRRCRGGIRALPEGAWDAEYTLLCALYRLCAECEFLTGDIAASEGLFDVLVVKAANALDRASAYAARMALREHSLDHASALHLGSEGLKLLGMPLPPKAGLVHLMAPLAETLCRLKFSPPGKPSLPKTPVPADKQVAMRLLSHHWTAAFLSGNENLQGLSVLMMMRISLRDGYSEYSSIAWIFFAVFRSSVMKGLDAGYRLAEEAISLAEHFGNPILLGRVRLLFVTFFNHHRNPFSNSYAMAQKAFDLCRSTGDWLYAGYCNDMALYLMYVQGFPMKRIELEIREMEAFARAAGHKATLENIAIIRRRSEILGQASADPKLCLAEDLSAGSIATDKPEKGFFMLCEWQMALCFKHLALARKISREIRGNPLLDPTGGLFPEWLVLDGLTGAAFYPGATAREKRGIRRKLRGAAGKLGTLSGRCPCNFAHLHALLSAEAERVRGRHEPAFREYEKAIALAEKGGFVQYAAIANERAGELCLDLDRPKAAMSYLTGAYRAYRSWGAFAKADEMRLRFPGLVSFFLREGEEENVNRADFKGFTEAARALSGEIILPRLLKKLLEILTLMSGAQRVILLFPKETDFTIAVEWPAPAGTANESVLPTGYPLAVANYVARTERAVHLPNPEFDFLFKSDAYLMSHRPRSALCLPLVHQGKLLALIYLENDSDYAAFEAGKIQLLQLIANQAAISISNARFHVLQLEAQQSKINPHFLFNALTSIAELSVTDGLQAEKAILHLANLYRYILRQANESLVELEQELETVQSYLALEQLRLGQKLTFDILVSGEPARVRLPGLLIQPLVENSIKHGIAPKMGPGHVEIQVEITDGKCRIAVRDDGLGAKAPVSSGTGFGLKSVQERLALVYHQNFSFAISSDSGYRVEIEIPIVPEEALPTPYLEPGTRPVAVRSGQAMRW